MSYITRNQYGAFCSACGEGPLSIEEDDWDCCDACGGEGLGGDDSDALEPDYEPLPPQGARP